VNALVTVPAGYRWALTLAIAALIIGLSITPGAPRPGDNVFSWLYAGTPPTAQKILHVIMYAVMAFLWMWTLAGIESSRTRLFLSLALTTGLGFGLEWYQTRVPGRFGTLIDMLLNALGAVIGLLAAVIII
jgi:hypothetical protein